MSIRTLSVVVAVLCVGCSGRAPDRAATAAASEDEPLSREQLLKFGGSFFTEPPPASLDRLYPPVNPRMEYRDLMRDMYMPQSFFRQEAKRGRWESARRSWARFIERFARTRSAVPEWQSRFGTVEEWRAAIEPILASGHTPADAEKLERAHAALFTKYCEECHQTDRLSVFARYHFGNFRAVWVLPPKVDDPLTEHMLRKAKTGKTSIPDGTVTFRDYMKLMNTSLLDASNFADAGDFDGARAAVSRLESYLVGLPASCAECHGAEPRRYFVDADSLDKFHAVAGMLAGPTVDRAAVIQGLNDAFDNTCARCHNVHFFAAKLQRAWALAAKQVAPIQ